LRPRLQRRLALPEIGVTIVDGGHAPDRARDMVEEPVDDMGCDVQTGHPGRCGSPEIVKDPAVDIGFFQILASFLDVGREQVDYVLVEPILGLAETRDGPFAVRREQVWAGL
jgi:hypothetical protein